MSATVGAWLAPLGALYGGAAGLRSALYTHGLLPRARLRGPVISVGNLSVGGSGKTPLVALLAERLRERGLPVAVLSRGYRGSFRGEALVVGDGERVLADAGSAGDEAALLARHLPGVVVAVGRRRDRVGRAVEERFGPRVHILDDGFQHLRLARDLDLLCLDAADLDDRPLPAGRLRERPGAAARADILLVTGVDGARFAELRETHAALRGRPAFRYGRRVVGCVRPDGAAAGLPSRAWLLSGIARPGRFAGDARAAGVEVLGHSAHPDHSAFSRCALDEVAARARAAGAEAILTTAKDAVRIAEPPASPPLLVFEIAAEIDGEAELVERVLEAARRLA